MQQQQIEWRRAKVMELLSKGECNQCEIARMLQVDRSSISRDIAHIREQSKDNIKRGKHGILRSRQKIGERRYRRYH
jgi:transcriptional regulator